MLSINISELIWTIINFFLLYFLLKRFLYKPICEHMDARQARIDAGLAKEREARETLEAENARLEEEKQTARELARTLLQQTEERAAAEREESLRQAKLQAKENEQQALEQLQSQSRQEDALLAEAEPALVELLARRLLREEADGT
ncbi:MAG: ATP synthase F0 subunit B [Oscillospiraceae bacterium]|nr:ATP synthase F0 subunit B [Oscillospiraceae bacterium]